MTDQHPITPPPELADKWTAMLEYCDDIDVFTDVARWGANQELEACCEWMKQGWDDVRADKLRAARRPKPPSPKEEALQVLEALIESRRIVDPEYQALRHALEQLDD